MADSTTIDVHPLTDVVAQISQLFELVEGRPQLSDAAFGEALYTLKRVPESAHDLVATEMVAVALKFKRAGEAATKAVVQLCMLVAEFIDDAEVAEALFRVYGMETEKAKSLIGAETSKRPVDGNVTDYNSAFSLRLNRK